MKQTIKLVAFLAIVSVGLFAGAEIMSSKVGGNKSTLASVNVEALSNEEQSNKCRWERKTDVCGCVYHDCTPEGNGYLCRCGDTLPY